jgi:hypothetical protein
VTKAKKENFVEVILRICEYAQGSNHVTQRSYFEHFLEMNEEHFFNIYCVTSTYSSYMEDTNLFAKNWIYPGIRTHVFQYLTLMSVTCMKCDDIEVKCSVYKSLCLVLPTHLHTFAKHDLESGILVTLI